VVLTRNDPKNTRNQKGIASLPVAKPYVFNILLEKKEKHLKKIQMIEAVMTQNNGQGPWTPKNGEL
jgi:tagatose-1,6-bisphosphate aldolase non-catalytic subunit AgaZ/GatZ